MFDTDAALYGRDRRTSIRFFWIGVAVCLVTATAFFVRTWRFDGLQYAVLTSFYPVLLAFVVSLAMGSAVANAYFEGGFAISLLNATVVALAFGLAVVFSSVLGVDSHADAPQVLVLVTFVGISAFGGLLAWGIGNSLRGMKSGSNE